MPKSRPPPDCTIPVHLARREKWAQLPSLASLPPRMLCSSVNTKFCPIPQRACSGACSVCLPSPCPPSLPSSPEAPFTQPPFLAGCFNHLVSCLLANKRVPRSTPTACKATGKHLPGRGGGRGRREGLDIQGGDNIDGQWEVSVVFLF